MITIQMTLDEELVRAVDRVAQEMQMNRSAFTREALREALKRYTEKQEEARHRRGYAKKPVQPGEFSDWEAEQAWGDA
ncbi:MAG: ribbon-helix-helix protein, CopG family [Candidatus Hydrogenedentes bacterium]|nr:ribbon-helix-helix protein, CopG family [Candidatus Hydrogenedentota bacterium]